MVEGNGLENRRAGNGTVGSNPTPSANDQSHELPDMTQSDSTHSPHWNTLEPFCSAGVEIPGFPFDEGFPDSGPHNPAKLYELITRFGIRELAVVDYSTQYRSEGLRWQAAAISGSTASIGKQLVAAWREIPTK